MKRVQQCPFCISQLDKIAQFLKEYRINSGYSQDYVSSNLNIPRRTICRIENGKNFTVVTLIKLVDFYNLNLNSVFDE